MSFVSSSSTVTVKAFLTAAGRKKLFDSLETTNEPFITKFALGDSDANYASIAAGYGILNSGFVPSPGEFKPRIRSFALYQGQYKPSVAHILISGRYGGSEGHYRTFPIGSNEIAETTYTIETEWPRKSKYDEDYAVSYSIAGTSSNALTAGVLARYFRFVFGNNALFIQFLGGMDLSTLQNIIGPDSGTNNGWTLQVRIEGLESQAVTVINIDFVQ